MKTRVRRVGQSTKSDKRIVVRLTETEHNKIRSIAATSGKTLSEIVRESATRTRVWIAPRNEQFESNILCQVGGISTNMGKLAQWATTHKSTDTLAILAKLNSMHQQLEDLIDDNQISTSR